MGILRKATIVGTFGTARAVGMKPNSKKERLTETAERTYKLEKKKLKKELKGR